MNVKEGKKGIGWFVKSLFVLALIGTVLGTAVGIFAFWRFSSGLPKIIEVSDYRPLTVTRIYGSGGKENALFGEFYKERRYLIPYDKIPEKMVHAFIAAEDDRFFEHQGVNLASIIRAAIVNFKAGHYVQGGSTITQQVVKSLLLTPERSFIRKIKEVILASRIEKNLTKQQILYLYLNQIYLGLGAYGVQAAAKTYFRKDVSALTLGEVALLAGMPQAPGKYSPHLNPKRAKERQLYVLRRMYENKYISQTELTEAAAEPIKIFTDEDTNTKYSGYLVEHIRRYLVEKYGDKAVYEEGLTVFTPARPELAEAAKNSIKEGVRQVDKRLGYRGPVKRITNPTEVENTLKEQRLQLIERKLQYKVFTPDGRLDAFEALKAATIAADVQLLDINGIYPAIVSSTDDKKKTSGVLIGALKAELPLEKMKWAKPVKEEKPRPNLRGEPTAPSKVLYKGDLILVRVESITGNHILVSLEQEPELQGALMSFEAQTGNVLAMEGGYDFKQSEFNRAVQAFRQPGSAFKPIIYSAAMEKGFSPASVIVDSPLVYGDDESGKWKPTNFEEKFYGDTTFRQALIKSRNVPTIKIVQEIQVPFVIDFAKRLGLSGQFSPDLSISLGSGSVSLYELTKAYAVFPRLGRKVSPIFINEVKDRDGLVLEEQKPVQSVARVSSADGEPVDLQGQPTSASPRPQLSLPLYPDPNDSDQVLDPRIAYVMTHLMKEVVAYGTGHGAKDLSKAAAGKTGTTNEYLDAWFLGFVPEVVTGVWVGYDSQRSLGPGETGARAALPIWLSYMREAVKDLPESDFNIPPGVVFVSIDPASGKRAAPNSSFSIKEAFLEGSEPTEVAGPSGTRTKSQSEFFKEDID